MRNIRAERDLARTEARVALANRDILFRCADALVNPADIKEVQKVLRETAKTFEEDAQHHGHNARALSAEYNEQQRRK